MKRKIKVVDKNKLDQLLTKLYTTPSSGATLPHPGYYPDLFKEEGFGQRNSSSNVFLGSVITKPNSNRYILGSSYFDLSEGKPNEDLFEIDPINSTIEAHYKGSLDKSDPLYNNTHKASKDYLLTKHKRIEILIKQLIYLLRNKTKK